MAFKLTDFLDETIANLKEIQEKVGGNFWPEIQKHEKLKTKITSGQIENEFDYNNIIEYILTNIDKRRKTNCQNKLDFLEKECVRLYEETYQKFRNSSQLLAAISFSIQPEVYPKFRTECLHWIHTYLTISTLPEIIALIRDVNPDMEKDFRFSFKDTKEDYNHDFWCLLAKEQLEHSLEATKEIFQIAVSKLKTFQILETYLLTISEQYENPDDALKFLKPFYDLSSQTNKKILTPNIFLKYAQLSKNVREREEILQLGYHQYPNLEIAVELLKIKMDLDSPDLVTLFELFCIKKHPELSIIKLELQYLLLKRSGSKFDITNEWYLKYIDSHKFSDKLSIEYLQWMAEVKGTVRLREAFLHVMKVTPTAAVIETMIKLENGKSLYVTQKLIKAYCDIFGTVDLKPWNFSVDMNLNNISLVHKMAKQRVKNDDNFLTEFKEIINVPTELY